jgi:FkbM family methyltransferase
LLLYFAIMANETPKIKPSLLFSLLYNFLVKFYWLRKTKPTYRLWKSLWDFSSKSNVIVKTDIHGFPALVPAGHWYLLVLKTYPKFNQPLISLLKFTEFERKRNLRIIDVGSAVGDTVLLLESSSPEKHSFFCVDGDEEYHNISQINLKFLKNRKSIIHSLVSDNDSPIAKILKENPTTGTAISKEKTEPRTLDDILVDEDVVDLVKIDIDGFDGKAVSGMKKTIAKNLPNIIFEWNVPLFEKTNNRIFQPFLDLVEIGYQEFYWFDNTGNFLFFQDNYNEYVLEKMAFFSNLNKEKNGYHFDIIAIYKGSNFFKFIT